MKADSEPRNATEMQQNFAENLKLACSFSASISSVCRELGINRTQFNRYLRATARPSANILNRLCDHFGVEGSEFHLPPTQFSRIIALKRKTTKPRPAYADTIDNLRSASLPAIKSYLGYYYVYYFSMSSPGKILRGVAHIFANNTDVFYRRIERFPDPNLKSNAFKCRYSGAAFMLDDRIFLIDTETLTGNEITQTILFPSRRNKINRLSGLMMGVSSSNQRRIACSRIIFEWLGERIDARKVLRSCGLFSADSEEIAPSIRQAIDNAQQTGAPLFYPHDM